jgi:hypothetical protein
MVDPNDRLATLAGGFPGSRPPRRKGTAFFFVRFFLLAVFRVGPSPGDVPGIVVS